MAGKQLNADKKNETGQADKTCFPDSEICEQNQWFFSDFQFWLFFIKPTFAPLFKVKTHFFIKK